MAFRSHSTIYRCILEIEPGGIVGIIMLGEYGPEEAHYADVAARSGSTSPVSWSATRARCHHEPVRIRALQLTSARQINIYDVKSRLSRLITDIEDTGQGIVIARRGRPVAELVLLHSIERVAR
jgi:Antitoxin Phd_YefM, type II toxin-antitoxin system